MSKNLSKIISETIKIKTLSPIHIKGKDIEYGQGFVRRDDKTAFAINNNNLIEFLIQKDPSLSLFNNYLRLTNSYIMNKGRLPNDDKRGLDQAFLSDNNIYDYRSNKANLTALIKAGVFHKVVNATSSDKFIKNGFGYPYIPGSSIKGMIRTAIMYHLLKKELSNGGGFANDFINSFDVKISNFMGKVTGKKKEQKEKEKAKFSIELQRDLLQNHETILNTSRDYLRCLKVKDSKQITNLVSANAVVASITNEEMSPPVNLQLNGTFNGRINNTNGYCVAQIGEKQFDFSARIYKKQSDILSSNIGKSIKVTINNNIVNNFELISPESVIETDEIPKSSAKRYYIGYKKTGNNLMQIPVEYYEGTVELEISIDLMLLHRFVDKDKYPFLFNDISSLLELVRDFSKSIWNHEKCFFDNCVENNNPEFSIQTVKEFYNNNYEGNVCRLGWGTGLPGMTVDLLLSHDNLEKLRNTMFIERNNFPVPKSRRLVLDNNKQLKPLGWIQL